MRPVISDETELKVRTMAQHINNYPGLDITTLSLDEQIEFIVEQYWQSVRDDPHPNDPRIDPPEPPWERKTYRR